MRENELMHFGVKGQKWGVRRYQNKDGSLTPAGKKHYSKQAKKDAKEYARAKMFYGEGAGNRRKLIKAQVEERSKNNPYYKEEFDRYLSEQDMAAHANAAKRERHVKDAKNTAGKTARGIYHLTVQDGAKVAAGLAITYGILHATGLDKVAVSKGKEAASKVATNIANARARAHVAKMMKNAAT